MAKKTAPKTDTQPDPRPSSYDSGQEKIVRDVEPGQGPAITAFAAQPLPYDVRGSLKETIAMVIDKYADSVTSEDKDNAQADALDAIEKIIAKDREEMLYLYNQVEPLPPSVDDLMESDLTEYTPAKMAELIAAWTKEVSFAAKDSLVEELKRHGVVK